MNQLKLRLISFVVNNETFLIPAYSRIERANDYLLVRFIIEANLAATNIDAVVVTNEDGVVKMITSAKNEIRSGMLYDQLLDWYTGLVSNWEEQ